MRGAILETERLYFRELTPDDFDAVCRIMQDEETMRAVKNFRGVDMMFWLYELRRTD